MGHNALGLVVVWNVGTDTHAEGYMFSVPSQFLSIVEVCLRCKHTLKVKGSSLGEELEMLRNSQPFVFKQLKDGFWGLVSTSWKLVTNFRFTGSLLTI